MDVPIRSVGRTGAIGGVSAVVEYDYTAKESDELDLVKGAIIHNIRKMPGGWWEGTLQSNSKTGMFPDNFVRVVLGEDNDIVTLREKSATTNRRCKVIYSYTQVNDDELSLAVGDVIEFLGEVEEGWWRGRLKNKIGVFPSNFVVAIESSPVLACNRPVATVKPTPTVPTSSTSPSVGSSAVLTTTNNKSSHNSSKEDSLSSKPTVLSTFDNAVPTLPPKPLRDLCRVEFPYGPQNEDELELKVGDIINVISMDLPDKGWWKGELRGKVGVFPDNFVKLLLSEVSADSQTGAFFKQSIATSATSSTNATSATTSKVFIKKSGSTSSTQSSNRKDSFGSRDSLNDILSETGLQSGNVAAQRKSLENKNLDLSNIPDVSSRLGLKKAQLQQQQEMKSVSTNSVTTTSTAMSSTNSYTTESRKSVENIDEKTKTPPPVLTKKPIVPTKKSATVTSVAGNILSGLKQKVKTAENKLPTTVSQDYADGMSSSKISTSGLPDDSADISVVIRRAEMISVEDTDFDRVERASILSDMRAGRVKAPKRRPPSAAINVIGESNNNNNNDSIYINGTSNVLSNQDYENNMADDDLLAKPKSRDWEKMKAPWMDELKASQVKKKSSPSIEPRSSGTNNVAERKSKLPADDIKITTTTPNTSTANSITNLITPSSIAMNNDSDNSVTNSTIKVQSSSISSSNILQQSVTSVDSSQQELLTKQKITLVKNSNMGKLKFEKLPEETTLPATLLVDDMRTRPNSLSIRNRSVSPLLSGGGSGNLRSVVKKSASPAALSSSSIAAAAPIGVVARSTSTLPTSSDISFAAVKSGSSSSHCTTTKAVYENSISTSDGVDTHHVELEKRVEKLETVVQLQQRRIDELVKTLSEETDRVKTLRGELDKYAQCVTQV